MDELGRQLAQTPQEIDAQIHEFAQFPPPGWTPEQIQREFDRLIRLRDAAAFAAIADTPTPQQGAAAPPTADGGGLDVPTIRVPGAVAGSKYVFGGPDAPAETPKKGPFAAMPLRAPVFLVPVGIALLVIAMLRVAAGAAPAAASAIPTSTSRPATASAQPIVAQTAIATPAARPRVVASSVQTVQQPKFANCSFKWTWSLDGVTKTDLIRIHFTGTNSHPSSTQDVRDFATLETNYKDGVYTWFGSGDIGGGEYTAQVIQLGPDTSVPPDGPTLLHATC